MGTKCAAPVADLFLFFWDFIMSLSDHTQADIIEAFYTTSRYLDDILNISNTYFDIMVSQIYPQSSNTIKIKPMIPKLRFWTCICQFLMILFLP